MMVKVLTLMRFKCIPLTVYQISSKKYNFLNLYFFNVSRRYCSTNGKDIDTTLFDTMDIQKYLNFITSTKSQFFRTREIEQINQLLQNKKDTEAELKNLQSMSSENDKELEKLIVSEKQQYLDSLEEIKEEILACLTSQSDENDNRNVELQIQSGIGGEESKLFSKELFQMYINYAEYKNWKINADLENSCINIDGNFVFGHLKHEAGVHRVQRVPATEKCGRIHTSTCSVIILPQPKPYEICINEKDLIIDKMKSSGPGGQNVNKRETCIRIKHIPTGVVIENQTSRYQYENLRIAILKLQTILYNKEQQKILLERKTLRKDQLGLNEYTDKIRTYNYPKNRVTDHRLNYTGQNLIGFLLGGKELDYLINQLIKFSKKKELISHVNNILNSEEYKNFERQKN